MKLQEFYFKRPIKVLQVFKNVHQYTKASKSFEVRKDHMEWMPIKSAAGYVLDGQLFINPQLVDMTPALNTTSLLVISDTIQEQFRFHTFAATQSWTFDLFKITPAMEVFLQYNVYTAGIPERDNFKLGDLSREQALEIKINGKFDFTMSAGKERTFIEQQYILQYLGEWNTAKILKEPVAFVEKSIPKDRKMINLLKPLW